MLDKTSIIHYALYKEYEHLGGIYMKFCQKCGKELSEDAEMCIGCGCETEKDDNLTPIKLSKETNKKPKIKKLWIILGAVALFLGVVVAVLFVPRNLKMDDFKKTNVVSAIIQYGLPESISSDEDGVYLQYGDKVDFYGITPYALTIYPEEDKVVFFFGSDDDGYEVYKKIKRYCDFEENLLSFHKFSYENLRITTNDYDGSYVSIEIN